MSAFDPKSPPYELTVVEVRGFQKLWKREFKEKLPDTEARAKATKLLELYRVLYSPTPKERERGEMYSRLTAIQRDTLSFVERSLSDGHSSSLREIARGIGCKSSRTAFKVVGDLIRLGWLK